MSDETPENGDLILAGDGTVGMLLEVKDDLYHVWWIRNLHNPRFNSFRSEYSTTLDAWEKWRRQLKEKFG